MSYAMDEMDNRARPQSQTPGVLDRLYRWLVDDVAGELDSTGSMKLTINISDDRRSIKTTIERYQKL